MRYIIMGGIMEYMAHLHCEAASEKDALEQWEKAFPTCPVATFQPKVSPAIGDLERHYVKGHRYYSGGYRYKYWQ